MIPWRRDRLPTPVFLGFPGGLNHKESVCNAGDLCSIPGSGRSPGGGHSNPLQCSCLENSRESRAWKATVHRFAKSQTGLSDFHFQIPQKSLSSVGTEPDMTKRSRFCLQTSFAQYSIFLFHFNCFILFKIIRKLKDFTQKIHYQLLLKNQKLGQN